MVFVVLTHGIYNKYRARQAKLAAKRAAEATKAPAADGQDMPPLVEMSKLEEEGIEAEQVVTVVAERTKRLA